MSFGAVCQYRNGAKCVVVLSLKQEQLEAHGRSLALFTFAIFLELPTQILRQNKIPFPLLLLIVYYYSDFAE